MLISTFPLKKNIKHVRVVLSPKVEKIPDRTFNNMKELIDVYIPSTITDLGSFTFSQSYVRNIIFYTRKDVEKNVYPVLLPYAADLITAFEEIHLRKEKPAPLTTLKTGLLSQCRNIASFVLPDTVVTIEKLAFFSCAFSKFVVNPTSQLKTICKNAFLSASLPTIYIPENVKSLEESAFENSTLQSIDFAKTSKLEVIQKRCFYQCYALKSLHLPKHITELGEELFQFCPLKSVSFPSNCKITNIPRYCFANTSLQEISIPKSIRTIAGYAFYCSKLSNIEFLGSLSTSPLEDDTMSQLKTIGEYCFAYCDQLQTVALPKLVTSLGSHTFYASGIKTISFEGLQHLQHVPESCFEECIALKSVTISRHTQDLGSNIFANCILLSNITFEDGGNCTSFSINCFNRCISLKYILVPSHIEVFKANCFSNSGILIIEFDKVSKIRYLHPKCLYDTMNLKYLELPDSITSLSCELFKKTALKTIKFINSRLGKIIFLSFLKRMCFEDKDDEFGITSIYDEMPPKEVYLAIDHPILDEDNFFDGCISADKFEPFIGGIDRLSQFQALYIKSLWIKNQAKMNQYSRLAVKNIQSNIKSFSSFQSYDMDKIYDEYMLAYKTTAKRRKQIEKLRAAASKPKTQRVLGVELYDEENSHQTIDFGGFGGFDDFGGFEDNEVYCYDSD